MTAEYPTEIPIACSLTADELGARGLENAALFARAQSVSELPDGFRFTFPAGEDNARDLLAFIREEAACCPFFTFELTFPSPHQAIWLALRGREGVKEILRVGFIAKLAGPGDTVAGAMPGA
jgi:hypothetical protein